MRPPNPELKENIIKTVIPLFAKSGYTGVSMRDIAAATGMTAASLYHHFSDKETLYVHVLKQAFAHKKEGFLHALQQTGSQEERLQALVTELCRTMAEDPEFHALMQRELLENDTRRLQILADEVFQDFFEAVSEFAGEFGHYYDPHLLAQSILGLVVYHYEIRHLKPFLYGYRPELDETDCIAGHIATLLTRGLFR